MLVLERGLKILEFLMLEKRPMSINEIAKCKGITLSAAYRILKTLEATGWGFQMLDDKQLRLKGYHGCDLARAVGLLSPTASRSGTDDHAQAVSAARTGLEQNEKQASCKWNTGCLLFL